MAGKMSPNDSDCNKTKKRDKPNFSVERGTHIFRHPGGQGKISWVNGTKADKQHGKIFQLAEKGGQ